MYAHIDVVILYLCNILYIKITQKSCVVHLGFRLLVLLFDLKCIHFENYISYLGLQFFFSTNFIPENRTKQKRMPKIKGIWI